jgi:hypothetical protein
LFYRTIFFHEVTEDHESTSNDIHVASPGSSSKLSNELIDLMTHTLKTFCVSLTENKAEDEFDIVDKKFASDLRFLDPQQRVIVETIVSDAVYFGKLGKLNEYTSIQLSSDTCRNEYHPGPGYLQSPTSTSDKQRASSNASISHCTPAACEEWHTSLQFNKTD